MKRREFKALIGAAAIAPSPAFAQGTIKPIRIVVPFPAGSATDTIARVLSAAVSKATSKQLIVDNKPGADGAIAAVEVARAPADGYTLLLATNSPMSAVPTMKKNPPYNPVADFTPITDVGRYTLYIVAGPTLPITSIADLIKFAKENPGKVNYATGNTTSLISMALLASLKRIEMSHVPYRGEPQAITDLIGGHVGLMMATSSTAVPQIQRGKLQPLVVALPRRSYLLPKVPTVIDAGLPELLAVTGWAGLFGPAGMLKEAVALLNKEFTEAIVRPEVQEALEQQEFVLNASTPDELAKLVKDQLESYRTTLRTAGIAPE